MDEVASLPLGRASVWTNSERIREELPNLIATWNMMVADGDKSAVIQAEGQTAEDLLTEHSLRADVDAPVFFTLCRSLLSTDISSAGQLLRLSTGGVEIDPIDLPIFPTPRQSEVTTSPPLVKGETMNQLGQRLILQGRSEITPTTAQGWRTALRFWEETHGNIGWDAITRRKVDEWLDLLKQRPKRIGRSVDNVPLPELVKLLSHDIKVPRLSGKTVRQHLGALSAIWGKVGAKGWIEREDNPFSKHDVRIDHTPKGKPLTVAELNAVFGLPVFSANARPKRGRGEACYWVPLFALFTGARPGEIAKLIVSDFWQADGGKWMMRYTDEGEHPAIGKRHLKTSIHGTGERMFPVPQPLLDLRLPLYLQWLHKQGAAALFPKLTRTTKGLYDGWGRWWAEYVDEVKTPDKRPLRELRHNFPTAARKSGVAEEAISYILGHTIAGQRTTSRYGERESWGEQIQQVRFDGLEFASIIPWGAPR
jgi:integrase